MRFNSDNYNVELGEWDQGPVIGLWIGEMGL